MGSGAAAASISHASSSRPPTEWLEMQRIDFLAHKLCLKRACFDYYHAAGALRKAQARLIRGKCDSWPCSFHGKDIGMKSLGFTNFLALYEN